MSPALRPSRKKKWRILLLMHESLVPPDSIEGLSSKEFSPFKTEYDVLVTLRDLGHEVEPLGVSTDLGVIRKTIKQFEPDITFNLLEEFHGISVYDHHVVSYLELLKKRYTGCNPRGLMLAHDKALSKKVCAFHRIPVPDFMTFPIGRKIREFRKIPYPMIVKSLTLEGSEGIAKASLVQDFEQLCERVDFVHRQLGTDAIAEKFIPGRELYVGILGNNRLQTLPIWELHMDKLKEGDPKIATAKLKWDEEYQKKLGVHTSEATLDDATKNKILKICKRAYRTLNLTGYARMDLRLADDGELALLEANPNPQLSYGEDFAESAESMGISYEALLTRILKLGFAYRAHWQD